MILDCIEVCAAIVISGGRVLMATRRPGSHLSGKWEFPGGKIRDGETSEECVKRELREELSLDVKVARELFRMEFQYDEKRVGLHFMLCNVAADSEAKPMEGQHCGWFTAAEAQVLDLAPADAKAIELMVDAANGNPHDECAEIDVVAAKQMIDFWLTANSSTTSRLPEWLHVSFGGAKNHIMLKGLLRNGGLHTVCESANCPNRSECWKHKTATFMILGNTCTRFCRFCSVNHGVPEPIDPAEPEKVADSVVTLGLRYAVLTCVTRDDLPDGGAAAMAAPVEEIHRRSADIRVEVLCSDYGGDFSCIDTVLAAGPSVYGHNVETVERLTPAIRNRAEYRRSLAVLEYAAAHAPAHNAFAKSGLMLGLGESKAEIRQTLVDLHNVGVEMVTLGQYLRPTRKNWPVARYVPPEEFDEWRQIAEQEIGLKRAVSGPFVRSSYMAEEAFMKSLE